MAEAVNWVAKITTVALEMVLPGVLGWWLDQQWGTGTVLTLVGFGTGLLAGGWHLYQMTADAFKNGPADKDSEQ